MSTMTELGYVTYGEGDSETAIVTVLEVDPETRYLVRRRQVTFGVATGALENDTIDFMSAGLCRTVLEMLAEAES